MSRLTLEKAKEILKKHTTEDHLFTHAQSVSAAMGAMADYFHEDRDHWEAIGYLHDVDYEEYPEEHCRHVREFLAPKVSMKKISMPSFPMAGAYVRMNLNPPLPWKKSFHRGRIDRHHHGIRTHAS